MPLRVHVKGKGKAPPPPNDWTINPSNVKSTAVDNCKEIRTFCSSSINVSLSNDVKRKKALAPQPPYTNISTISNEMNNLSAVSHRTHDKSPTKATNLNILDTNSIQLNAVKDMRLTAFDVNANQIIPNRFDAIAQANRYNEIWICTNCTLQNPFWKIVCDACERIKPYNTPNIQQANIFRLNEIDGIMDNKNLVISVQMRSHPKASSGKSDKVLQRNSMQPNFQYHSNGIQCHGNDDKIFANKRISLYANDMKNDKHALEMEKERIRHLIRSLNNRALHSQTRSNRVGASASPKVNNNKNKTVNKNHSNVKHPTCTKHLQPYNMNNDYNFPTKSVNDGNCRHGTDKIDVLIQINKKLDRPNKGDKYYACIDDLKRGVDVNPLRNRNDQHPYESLKMFDESNATTITVNNGAVGNNAENKMSLNVFVNFNKAIEITVPGTMPLKIFKCHITNMIAPCKCPKIYFNGLQLQNDEQTLANYGILDRSSIYVNTENVIAHTSSPKPITSKSIATVHTKTPSASNVAGRANQISTQAELNEPAINLNIPKAKPTHPIDHIQLNFEKFHPKNENITRTKYRGVYNYNPRCNPNFDEIKPQKRPILLNQSAVPLSGKKIEQKPMEPLTVNDAIENVSQYIELLSLDDSMDLTKNTEPFECPICLVDYQPMDGIILRNCLHTFCIDCTRNSIRHSDEAEVKCPYIDNEYSCEYLLQDREIKGILNKHEYDEHLAKSLRIAEHQIENSFHCRTPNCKGWCIYEDDVNIFKCPICQLVNCLTCRVIHDGLDCKQYQNMMKNNVDNNPENIRTLAMLDDMVKNGEAMHCPACRVILMKKWGCDWLKCSMCKTEICWVTRNYRWGAAGKGDTSGGCKCGIDGFKCHPKCNYCH